MESDGRGSIHFYVSVTNYSHPGEIKWWCLGKSQILSYFSRINYVYTQYIISRCPTFPFRGGCYIMCYLYTYTYTYTYKIHIHIHICIFICTYIYICVCMHIYIHGRWSKFLYLGTAMNILSENYICPVLPWFTSYSLGLGTLERFEDGLDPQPGWWNQPQNPQWMAVKSSANGRFSVSGCPTFYFISNS